MSTRLTDQPLWKVISLSKRHGNRISKSMPYTAALNRFKKFNAELQDGDHLYMVQVMERASGCRLSANEITIEAPNWLQGATA